MTQCDKCGCEVTQDDKFCPQCGARMNKKCPVCGKGLAETDQFCMYCGNKVNLEDQTNKSFENVAEEQKTGETVIAEIKGRIAFKIMILIAFIGLFFPICTVSCGQQVITSPNGYESAYNFGLSESQLEYMEFEIEDVADPYIGIVIVIMIISVLTIGKIKNTIQAILAIVFLTVFKNSERINSLLDRGAQVEFRFGYYLVFLSLLLAASAYFWGDKVFKDNIGMEEWKKRNHIITIVLWIVWLTVFITNPGIFEGIIASIVG